MSHVHASNRRTRAARAALLLLLSIGIPAQARAGEKSYDDRFQRAVMLSAKGRHAEAAEQLYQLAQSEPERKEAFLWLGHVRYRMQDWRGAREAYEQFVQRAPGEVDGVRGLGRSYAREGNSEQARRWLKKALELSPMDVEAKEDLERLDRVAAPPTQPRPAAEEPGFWRKGLAGVCGARESGGGMAIAVVIFVLLLLPGIPMSAAFHAGAFGGAAPVTAFLGALIGQGFWYLLFWGLPPGSGWIMTLVVGGTAFFTAVAAAGMAD